MLKWSWVFASGLMLAACQTVAEDATSWERADVPETTVMLTDVGQSKPQLDGHTIVSMAHAAAGGETFVNPGSLFLSGQNVIYGQDGGSRT